MTSNDDVAFVMQACKALGVYVRVGGTDDRPVVLVYDKVTRKTVGGIELNKRIEGLNRGG